MLNCLPFLQKDSWKWIESTDQISAWSKETGNWTFSHIGGMNLVLSICLHTNPADVRQKWYPLISFVWNFPFFVLFFNNFQKILKISFLFKKRYYFQIAETILSWRLFQITALFLETQLKKAKNLNALWFLSQQLLFQYFTT